VLTAPRAATGLVADGMSRLNTSQAVRELNISMCCPTDVGCTCSYSECYDIPLCSTSFMSICLSMSTNSPYVLIKSNPPRLLLRNFPLKPFA
jgi:hypothetical protein